MNWLRSSIRSTCLETKTVDPKRSPNKIFKYVDIAAIDRASKTIIGSSEIFGADAPSRARKEIHSGDIIVSTVRPNLNAVAIVPPELDGQIASTGFCILRSNACLILERYLFYFVQTKLFIDSLCSKVRGAHYPAVSDNDVKSLQIPIPPISEQRKIVEMIDEANNLRLNRLIAEKKFSNIHHSIFYKMFGDPQINPCNWSFKTLKACEAEVRYGLGQPPQTIESGTPLIRATNISKGTISPVNLLFVDPTSVPAGRNAFLNPQEVIVVRSGAYTGDAAQVTEEWSGAVAGYDLVVSPGPNLEGEFVETYLLTPFIQNGYFQNLKARAGQPHLNSTQLEQAPIPVVPIEKQKIFSSLVQQCRSVRKFREQQGEKIECLFANFLHSAFSGTLSDKWRNGHTKELLEELAAQTKILEKDRV